MLFVMYEISPRKMFVPLFSTMAQPMIVRKRTGSNQEVVVKRRMMKIRTTTMPITSCISFFTFSSMNLFVGDMPTR